MASNFFAIQGIHDLLQDIKELADALDFEVDAKGVANRALRNGAEPVLRQMKANASSDPQRISGDLYNALDKSNVKSNARRGKHITIGVHRKDWDNEDYYPAYVEFGHAGPAPAPAHPYIRPAYDVTEEQAYSIIRDELRKAIK